MSCPTISVSGPADVPEPNKPITFIASISEEGKKFNLKYNWSVSGGEIVEGQVTLILKVLQKNDSEENLTAAVEISGLPKNCVNTASETDAIICFPSLIVVDEFSTSEFQTDKIRLDNLAEEIQKNPNAQAFIIEKFESKILRSTIEQKNQMTIDYLKTKGIERNQINLLNGSADKNSTQFFIVPAGASPPTCDDCKTVQPDQLP